MKEAIRFEVVDEIGKDTEAEIVLDTDSNVFEFSILREVEFEKIFSGDWEGNLQQVFERALEIWKVESEDRS